jgi:hypothetical protein
VCSFFWFEETTILPNVRNYTPKDIASNSRKCISGFFGITFSQVSISSQMYDVEVITRTELNVE